MLNDHTNGKITDFSTLQLFVDGGCEPKNPGGYATSGWVLFCPKDLKKPLAEQGEVVQKGGPLATNNYGEYQSLVLALSWLITQKWRGELIIKADSKLLVEQVSGRWQVKAEHLAILRIQIHDLMEALNLRIITASDPLPPESMTACYLNHIPRELNGYANNLCRLAYKESQQ